MANNINKPGSGLFVSIEFAAKLVKLLLLMLFPAVAQKQSVHFNIFV